jgi:hypothetical protein
MTCLDIQTGQKRSQAELGVKEIFRASPTGEDGKIYCLSEAGTAVVLDTSNDCKVISTSSMGEAPVRSSIVAAQRHLFIRTARNLYCIGPS